MKFARVRALSALFIFFIAPPTWAANTTHDIVIVGAGSAGLYAAKTLNGNGWRHQYLLDPVQRDPRLCGRPGCLVGG